MDGCTWDGWIDAWMDGGIILNCFAGSPRAVHERQDVRQAVWSNCIRPEEVNGPKKLPNQQLLVLPPTPEVGMSCLSFRTPLQAPPHLKSDFKVRPQDVEVDASRSAALQGVRHRANLERTTSEVRVHRVVGLPARNHGRLATCQRLGGGIP